MIYSYLSFELDLTNKNNRKFVKVFLLEQFSGLSLVDHVLFSTFQEMSGIVPIFYLSLC